MLQSLIQFAGLAAVTIPRILAASLTDSYTDGDVGQSGYLPNHNMDPAVVDSTEFGILWSMQYNAQEQVGKTFFGRNVLALIDYEHSSTRSHLFIRLLPEVLRLYSLHLHRIGYELWTPKPVLLSLADKFTRRFFRAISAVPISRTRLELLAHQS